MKFVNARRITSFFFSQFLHPRHKASLLPVRTIVVPLQRACPWRTISTRYNIVQTLSNFSALPDKKWSSSEDQGSTKLPNEAHAYSSEEKVNEECSNSVSDSKASDDNQGEDREPPKKPRLKFSSYECKQSLWVSLVDRIILSWKIRDFNEFNAGIKEAIKIINDLVSKGDFDNLAPLLSPQCLESVRSDYATLPESQARDIGYRTNDRIVHKFLKFGPTILNNKIVENRYTYACRSLNLVNVPSPADITATMSPQEAALKFMKQFDKDRTEPLDHYYISYYEFSCDLSDPNSQWTLDAVNYLW